MRHGIIAPRGGQNEQFTWSKVSGPGTVTFKNAQGQEDTHAEDPTFQADTPGGYTVKVTWSRDGCAIEETSLPIIVLAEGWVEFDCTMTDNPASDVVTATGSEPIFNAHWNARSPKTKVYFEYDPTTTTGIRINAAHATSANNEVELDGNGVRSNGDDYTFSITP